MGQPGRGGCATAEKEGRVHLLIKVQTTECLAQTESSTSMSLSIEDCVDLALIIRIQQEHFYSGKQNFDIFVFFSVFFFSIIFQIDTIL